ncbi:unnamed protein product [Microthlaspi erraticum]|uniref:Uncharacterized protein n=1 Tax=Microthlaspi erraticum TaxID=1685480 RepID=A0A6D2HG07_9BRAS|nr:unnamed protein product [Microthlaspi erraticum]
MPKTWVCWDIDSCPVPDGYDAHLVGSSIRSALKEKGCYGPLTIFALGNLKLSLKRTPHVLPALSSTGILLNDVHGFDNIFEEFLRWTRGNRGHGILLFITGNELVKNMYQCFVSLEGLGYTILHANPQASPPSYENGFLWESLLNGVSGEVTRQALVTAGEVRFYCSRCTICPGESYEDFTKHLKSRGHKLRELDTLRRPSPKRKMVKPTFNVSNYINKKPKEKDWWIEEDRMSI